MEPKIRIRINQTICSPLGETYEPGTIMELTATEMAHRGLRFEGGMCTDLTPPPATPATPATPEAQETPKEPESESKLDPGTEPAANPGGDGAVAREGAAPAKGKGKKAAS